MISGYKNFIFSVNKLNLFSPCRYTLGGFFLASYEDSPAGVFDEVVYFGLRFFSLSLLVFIRSKRDKSTECFLS